MKSVKEKICAIVVLYGTNRQELESQQYLEEFVDKIYLVDNSEKPFPFSELKFSGKFEYIFPGYNSGCGGGFNIGSRKAIEDGYEYSITLNPDSRLLEKNFDKYIQLIEKMPDVAIFEPQYIFDRAKKIQLEDKLVPIKVYMNSGSIINHSIFQKVGGYDDSFLVDGEDYDYALRCVEKGYKCYQVLFYAIQHSPAITKQTKLFKIKYGWCSALRCYYQSRNMREIIKRHKTKRMYVFLFLCYKYFKILFFFPNRKDSLRMWKLGKKDFKARKFGIYETRR